MIKVIESDRIAAADYLEKGLRANSRPEQQIRVMRANILGGYMDDCDSIQAFAGYREALTVQDMAAAPVEMRHSPYRRSWW